jgi:hypothetical protein
MNKPRELTEEEVRERFLDHLWVMIDYWAAEGERDRKPRRDSLEGLAFSLLAALDGEAADLPGFIVAPHPHPDDKAFRRDNGEDWFPSNHKLDSKIKADIAGVLHELFYSRNPRRKKNETAAET